MFRRMKCLINSHKPGSSTIWTRDSSSPLILSFLPLSFIFLLQAGWRHVIRGRSGDEHYNSITSTVANSSGWTNLHMHEHRGHLSLKSFHLEATVFYSGAIASTAPVTGWHSSMLIFNLWRTVIFIRKKNRFMNFECETTYVVWFPKRFCRSGRL